MRSWGSILGREKVEFGDRIKLIIKNSYLQIKRGFKYFM